MSLKKKKKIFLNSRIKKIYKKINLNKKKKIYYTQKKKREMFFIVKSMMKNPPEVNFGMFSSDPFLKLSKNDFIRYKFFFFFFKKILINEKISVLVRFLHIYKLSLFSFDLTFKKKPNRLFTAFKNLFYIFGHLSWTSTFYKSNTSLSKLMGKFNMLFDFSGLYKITNLGAISDNQPYILFANYIFCRINKTSFFYKYKINFKFKLTTSFLISVFLRINTNYNQIHKKLNWSKNFYLDPSIFYSSFLKILNILKFVYYLIFFEFSAKSHMNYRLFFFFQKQAFYKLPIFLGLLSIYHFFFFKQFYNLYHIYLRKSLYFIGTFFILNLIDGTFKKFLIFTFFQFFFLRVVVFRPDTYKIYKFFFSYFYKDRAVCRKPTEKTPFYYHRILKDYQNFGSYGKTNLTFFDYKNKNMLFFIKFVFTYNFFYNKNNKTKLSIPISVENFNFPFLDFRPHRFLKKTLDKEFDAQKKVFLGFEGKNEPGIFIDYFYKIIEKFYFSFFFNTTKKFNFNSLTHNNLYIFLLLFVSDFYSFKLNTTTISYFFKASYFEKYDLHSSFIVFKKGFLLLSNIVFLSFLFVKLCRLLTLSITTKRNNSFINLNSNLGCIFNGSSGLLSTTRKNAFYYDRLLTSMFSKSKENIKKTARLNRKEISLITLTKILFYRLNLKSFNSSLHIRKTRITASLTHPNYLLLNSYFYTKINFCSTKSINYLPIILNIKKYIYLNKLLLKKIKKRYGLRNKLIANFGIFPIKPSEFFMFFMDLDFSELWNPLETFIYFVFKLKNSLNIFFLSYPFFLPHLSLSLLKLNRSMYVKSMNSLYRSIFKPELNKGRIFCYFSIYVKSLLTKNNPGHPLHRRDNSEVRQQSGYGNYPVIKNLSKSERSIMFSTGLFLKNGLLWLGMLRSANLPFGAGPTSKYRSRRKKIKSIKLF